MRSTGLTPQFLLMIVIKASGFPGAFILSLLQISSDLQDWLSKCEYRETKSVSASAGFPNPMIQNKKILNRTALSKQSQFGFDSIPWAQHNTIVKGL